MDELYEQIENGLSIHDAEKSIIKLTQFKLSDEYELPELPLLSLIFDKYKTDGYNMLNRIFPLLNNEFKAQLLNCKLNETHPIEYFYTRVAMCSLIDTFDFIEKYYKRDFAMIYKIRIYSEIECILDYVIINNYVKELVSALNKYKVTFDEFDFSIPLLKCDDYEIDATLLISYIKTISRV